MALDLEHPLTWKTATGDAGLMLDDLQNNILDGHGRKATRHLFLRFTDAAKGRAFIAAMAPLVHSARRQLRDAEAFRNGGPSGGPIVGVHLSALGYRALGVANRMPVATGDDKGAFAAGMRGRRAELDDPDDQALEPPYRGEIHAMILIGAEPDSEKDWQSAAAENVAQRIRQALTGAGVVVAEEEGRAIFSSAGPGKKEGIEHFGYVDGRSQPLLLTELIERERDESDGIGVWNPAFPLKQVLVPDPGSPKRGTAFGSFFVFRKLEQDVKGFKEAEEKLGEVEHAPGKKLGKLAGAMIVGRFEDGTPVTLQRDEGGDNPVVNNFDYASDMAGLRCPFSAHIRKTNPRGDTVRLLAANGDEAARRETEEEERSRIMARRGMTFGRRDAIVNPADLPERGVGLMFMSFQCNLADQFEFTQAKWANSTRFVAGLAGMPEPGRDPVIGQRGSKAAAPIRMRDRWGWRAAREKEVTFEEHVRFKGGEYFFTPAISTLAAMSQS